MELFIKAFGGRIAQYNAGLLEYFNKKDKSLLQQTILNNIFKSKENR